MFYKVVHQIDNTCLKIKPMVILIFSQDWYHYNGNGKLGLR